MRHGHGHPAQNSGWPVRVLHTAPAGGSCLLIPYSRSILASLTSLALAQSTAVTIITSADVKDSGALDFGAILIDFVLSRRAAGCCCGCGRRLRRRYGRRSGAAAQQPRPRGLGAQRWRLMALFCADMRRLMLQSNGSGVATL